MKINGHLEINKEMFEQCIKVGQVKAIDEIYNFLVDNGLISEVVKEYLFDYKYSLQNDNYIRRTKIVDLIGLPRG